MVFDMAKNNMVKLEDHIIQLPKYIQVPESSTAIHGISTVRMRREGVDIKPLLADFRRDLKQCHILIAHNLEFDRNMLQVEYYRHGFKSGIEDIRKIEFLYYAAWHKYV